MNVSGSCMIVIDDKACMLVRHRHHQSDSLSDRHRLQACPQSSLPAAKVEPAEGSSSGCFLRGDAYTHPSFHGSSRHRLVSANVAKHNHVSSAMRRGDIQDQIVASMVVCVPSASTRTLLTHRRSAVIGPAFLRHRWAGIPQANSRPVRSSSHAISDASQADTCLTVISLSSTVTRHTVCNGYNNARYPIRNQRSGHIQDEIRSSRTLALFQYVVNLIGIVRITYICGSTNFKRSMFIIGSSTRTFSSPTIERSLRPGFLSHSRFQHENTP